MKVYVVIAWARDRPNVESAHSTLEGAIRAAHHWMHELGLENDLEDCSALNYELFDWQGDDTGVLVQEVGLDQPAAECSKCRLRWAQEVEWV